MNNLFQYLISYFWKGYTFASALFLYMLMKKKKKKLVKLHTIQF